MRRRAQWQENHATCLAAYDAACRPAYPRNTLCSIPCSITYPAGRQRLLEEAVDEHISYYGISVIATYRYYNTRLAGSDFSGKPSTNISCHRAISTIITYRLSRYPPCRN